MSYIKNHYDDLAYAMASAAEIEGPRPGEVSETVDEYHQRIAREFNARPQCCLPGAPEVFHDYEGEF